MTGFEPQICGIGSSIRPNFDADDVAAQIGWIFTVLPTADLYGANLLICALKPWIELLVTFIYYGLIIIGLMGDESTDHHDYRDLTCVCH